MDGPSAELFPSKSVVPKLVGSDPPTRETRLPALLRRGEGSNAILRIALTQGLGGSFSHLPTSRMESGGVSAGLDVPPNIF